jgi:sigma-B regulation protein RsbU (phosphoserine phosphatase)
VDRLWDPSSYELRVLSAPFALALAALTSVIVYAVLMRGAAALRAWFLVHVLSIAPYAVAVAIAASTTDPQVATTLFRIGAAFIPLAAATGIGFQLTLVGQARVRKRTLFFSVIVALGWLPVALFSDAIVDGVRWLSIGMWFATPGELALVCFANILLVAGLGFIPLYRIVRAEPDPGRRRHWKRAFWSTVITFCGLVDVGLAYGVGGFPVAWFFIAVGSALTLRALVVDDLLRVRAVDTRVPWVLLYVGLLTLSGWAIIELVGRDLPWWLLGVALLAAFLGVRVSMAVIALINRGGRRPEGPIERLLGQLGAQSPGLRDPVEIAQRTVEVTSLAIGLSPQVILPARDDWSWRTPEGARLSERETPDPLLLGWLAESPDPVFRDELELAVEADLRPALETLFAAHGAAALVPLTSRDELVGLLLVPARDKHRLRRSDADFLGQLAPRAAAALVHARMAAEAREREALEVELELAGAIQAGFVPATAPHARGPITIVGSWSPATRCGGDFWSLHDLPGGATLVAIGDVTGHGVAAAMVTAAARGAIEIAVRRFTADGAAAEPLDLLAVMRCLDLAVLRAADGRRHLTCFLAVLDPGKAEVRFTSAGHVSPYICRANPEGGVELSALVARGNPLGAGGPVVAKTVTRPLLPGDLVVWYTDGLIEGRDASGQPFGDRRMQRLLRQLDPARLEPRAAHDAIAAATSSHRGGTRHDDDVTLVVAGVAAGAAGAAA